jgi:multidrug efflux pump subunit AcrB
LKDVGRAELGARDYGTNAYINDTAAIAILVLQRPGTNALQTSEDVQNVVRGFRTKFRPTITSHRRSVIPAHPV